MYRLYSIQYKAILHRKYIGTICEAIILLSLDYGWINVLLVLEEIQAYT